MQIIVALGGNALLKRGERFSADAQRANVRIAAAQLAKVAAQHTLVIVHGNGPQVGLLALQERNTPQAQPSPLDVLDAETEGMIGYMIEQELSNALPAERAVATLLTMVEVDPAEPAFAAPDKPIGPIYRQAEAEALSKARGWTFAPDRDGYRRVVASPQPRRIVEIRPLRWLLEQRAIVICAGGGGIPVAVRKDGRRYGVEAVIDKDRCAALLACELEADLLVIATDVPAVFTGWGEPAPRPRPIRRANPQALAALRFAAGSMQPKVEAACAFSRRSGRRAMIGALADIERLVAGSAGTEISNSASGIAYGGE